MAGGKAEGSERIGGPDNSDWEERTVKLRIRAHWTISGCSEHLRLLRYSCVGKDRKRIHSKEDRKQAGVTSDILPQIGVSFHYSSSAELYRSPLAAGFPCSLFWT